MIATKKMITIFSIYNLLWNKCDHVTTLHEMGFFYSKSILLLWFVFLFLFLFFLFIYFFFFYSFEKTELFKKRKFSKCYLKLWNEVVLEFKLRLVLFLLFWTQYFGWYTLQPSSAPVSLGCRIHQLHLCREVRPPPHD